MSITKPKLITTIVAFPPSRLCTHVKHHPPIPILNFSVPEAFPVALTSARHQHIIGTASQPVVERHGSKSDVGNKNCCQAPISVTLEQKIPSFRRHYSSLLSETSHSFSSAALMYLPWRASIFCRFEGELFDLISTLYSSIPFTPIDAIFGRKQITPTLLCSSFVRTR